MLSARLGKCRLCLKLGDFYSIFDDSALELANMAMSCANIQVQKGDGLPDKVCTECIEKLSASYIFKQQCERSDAELRKNLSLPLGEKPSNSNKTNHSPNKKSSKRSSHGGLLQEHYSVDIDENTSESSKTLQKRARDEISDSDDSGDDNCSKRSKRSSKASDSHSLKNVTKNADDSISSTKSDTTILERFACKACGKRFKYNVALLNHSKVCQELKMTQVQENKETVFTCTKCGKFYQTQSRLQSHIQNCKLPTENMRKQDVCSVDCSNCGLMFPNHLAMYQHFHSCLRDGGPQIIACNSCKIIYVQKNSLYRHIMKNHNPELNSSQNSINGANESINSDSDNLKCRKCSKVFSTQNQLVTHLAAHMANINDEDSNEQNSIGETIKYTCLHCDSSFQYEHNLVAHVKNEHEQNEESESADGKKKIYTCDHCSKTFTSKVSCDYHMNVKHDDKSIKRHKINSTSKPINLYNCAATCLKCQVHLRNGSEISVHNKMHRLENAKIQNQYNCPACEQTFTNTKVFRAHINFHNAQSQKPAESSQSDDDTSQTQEKDEEEYQNPLDFCETVVANIKSEPIEYSEQSENYNSSLSNYSQVLSVNLGGFSCTVCHKILPNLERYNNHIKQHKSKIHKCLICDQVFEFNSRLRIHMKGHEEQAKEDSSVLDCRICGRNSKNIRSYLFHANLHSQTERFECSVCQRMFKTKTAYISHHKSHYYRKSSGSEVPYHSNEAQSSEGKTQFKCHICRKCMPSEISLKCHVKWHQSSTAQKKKKYECMKCDQIFNCKQRYASHMSQHRFYENSNNLECKICKKTLENITKLKWHIKAHRASNRLKTKQKNHPCAVCGENFKFQSKLIEHIKRRHPISKMVKKCDPDGAPVQSYVCKICGKHFNTDAEMMTHRKRHSTKIFTSFKCTLCNKRSKNLKFHQQHVKGHLYQKLSADQAKCPHCDEEFDRRNKMNQHLATVHNVIENYTIRVYGKEKIKHTNQLVSLECSLCNKVLASQTTFQKHMDLHNSMRCNYCYKYFNSKMFLDAHLMYDCHKKNLLKGSDPFEKRLKCHVCLKPFSVVVKLNCHLRVQHKAEPKATYTIKEKYFACDFCFSTFSREDRMLSHRQVHVRPGYFGCKFCPRKFVNMIKFRKHKRNHYYTKYVDDPLSCSECSEKFVLLNDLLVHLEKVHNISDDWCIPPQEPVSELCHICNKNFTHLANHLVFHEKYKCKKCLEYFFSEIDFNRHACSVESEDESMNPNMEKNNVGVTNSSVPYEECEFCFKPYTTHFTKACHIVNHSRTNTFGCKFCGKTFTSVSVFNLHNLAHRMRSYKQNPLICEYCDQTFVKYALYTKHLLIDHQKKESMKIKPEYPPEECLICRKTFSNIHHHYRYHMNFRCRTCSKYIISQKLFDNHKCDNPDEDQSLMFTCDENIIPKTVAAFDYQNHLFKTAESGEIVKEKEHSDSHDTIDINECELDDTILQSFNCSENTSQPQSVNNDENTLESFDIVDIDDSSNEFAPRISSTVSLSASNEQEFINVE